MRRKSIWMYRGGKAGKALEDGVGGGVEELIGNAIDAAVCDGAQGLPAALLDHASQGDTISGAAPGEDEDIRVSGGNGFRRRGFAGVADEFAASSFDKFLDPGLRMDQRLAPLFAINAGMVGGGLQTEGERRR